MARKDALLCCEAIAVFTLAASLLAPIAARADVLADARFGGYVYGGIDNKDCGVPGNEGACFSDGLTPAFPTPFFTTFNEARNGRLIAAGGADDGFAAASGSASLPAGTMHVFAFGNHAAFDSNPEESNGSYANAGLTDTFVFHFAGPDAMVSFQLTGTGSAAGTPRMNYDF